MAEAAHCQHVDALPLVYPESGHREVVPAPAGAATGYCGLKHKGRAIMPGLCVFLRQPLVEPWSAIWHFCLELHAHAGEEAHVCVITRIVFEITLSDFGKHADVLGSRELV